MRDSGVSRIVVVADPVAAEVAATGLGGRKRHKDRRAVRTARHG